MKRCIKDKRREGRKAYRKMMRERFASLTGSTNFEFDGVCTFRREIKSDRGVVRSITMMSPGYLMRAAGS